MNSLCLSPLKIPVTTFFFQTKVFNRGGVIFIFLSSQLVFAYKSQCWKSEYTQTSQLSSTVSHNALHFINDTVSNRMLIEAVSV